MSSPWSKIEVPTAHSLADVMSEQLANELQETEIKKLQDGSEK
jgi:hypothetical protein